MATISKENYLKAIYGLSSKKKEIVSTSDLAKELDVSNAAITEMANKLSRQGFIEYEKYRGIKILEKGRKTAVNVIRKHRLWEIFLTETIGLDWGEVHDEAERLEHCTSNFLIDKIDEYLNYPKADPHGEPVPNQKGIYRTELTDFPMSECKIGKNYKVSRVNDRNPELMKYLTQINISLNKIIAIEDKLNFDGSVIISIDGVKHSLSEKLVKNIFLNEFKS